MKRLTTALFALLTISFLQAQSPQGFSYQGIARDGNSDPLANQNLGVQFDLHQTTATGTVVYTETHSPTTNDLGLFTLQVGVGTPLSGTFIAIDWGAGPYFLEVSMDPTGGSNYTSVGTQQLLSVPYALHAGDDGDWAWTATTISNDGKSVGIGTATPVTDLHVVGQIRYEDGTQGADKILVSDADGNASWQELNSQTLLGNGNTPLSGFDCLATQGTLGIGSSAQYVKTVGSYAYIVDQGSDDLKVVDVSDPTSPVLSGSLAIGTLSYTVDVVGNYAYVVDYGSDDLKVIDVSDPTTPTLSGSLGLGSTPRSVSVLGNYAYVVDQGSDDLKVIDVSTPSAPTLTGSVAIGPNAYAVDVLGNYAYIVDNSSQDLKVVDVSAPAAPVVVGSVTVGPNPRNLHVVGGYAYVVDYDSDDLKVIDISDPTTPSISGSLSIGSTPRSVNVVGDLAYIVDFSSDDLKVIDVSSPSSPTLVTSYAVGSYPMSVSVLGNYAYVVDRTTDDLKVIQLSCEDQYSVGLNPQTGELEAQLANWNNVDDDISNANNGNVGIGTNSPDTTLHLTGKFKYQDGSEGAAKVLTSDADGNASWEVFNANTLLGGGGGNGPDLSCMNVWASLNMGANPYDLFVKDQLAYVVHNIDDDLKIVDLSDPASPVVIGTLGIGPRPWSVVVEGNYAYVADPDSDDLKIIDVSDPTSPSLTGSIVLGSDPRFVEVSGSYAYVVDAGPPEVAVIDISNPAAPVKVGAVTANTDPRGMTLDGDHVYVADWDAHSLKAFDVSTPTAPVLAGTLGVGWRPSNVKISGNYAYLSGVTDNDLKVIDISDPTSLSLTGSVPIGDVSNGMALFGDHVFVLDYFTDNMRIIDVSDPAAPTVIDSLDLGDYPSAIEIVGNYAYIVDTGSDDLKVIELGCEQIVGIDPTSGELTAQGVTWSSNGSHISNANSGDVGIGTTAPTAKLSVNGDANNSTGSWGVFSDERVKTVNGDFTDGLDIVRKLRPVTFEYNDLAPFKAEGEQIGVIAQELEKVAPYMVTQQESGSIKDLREVNNQAYVFLLVNAIKEQQKLIEDLQLENQELQADNSTLQQNNRRIQQQVEANAALLQELHGMLNAESKRLQAEE